MLSFLKGTALYYFKPLLMDPHPNPAWSNDYNNTYLTPGRTGGEMRLKSEISDAKRSQKSEIKARSVTGSRSGGMEHLLDA